MVVVVVVVYGLARPSLGVVLTQLVVRAVGKVVHDPAAALLFAQALEVLAALRALLAQRAERSEDLCDHAWATTAAPFPASD